MLWKKPATSPIPRAPQPLPDVSALRRTALQTSWKRDKWVARRRIALRWVLWYSVRFGVPVLLGLAAVAAAALWALPHIEAYLAPAVVAAPAPTAPLAQPPAMQEPAQQVQDDAPLPLQIQLDRQWTTGAPQPFSFAEDDPLPLFLQSDYAMHSQEP